MAVETWRSRSRGFPLRQARDAALDYVGVGGGLLVLIGFLAITQDQFATAGNFLNIFETNAVLLVAGVGLTFVLLTGGFDLSIGAMLALSTVLLHLLLEAGSPSWLAIVLVITLGTLLGLAFNGVLIARLRLSFFVVTLGTASLFRGAALLKTGGTSHTLYTEELIREIGQGKVAGIPWAAIIALAVLLTATYVTRYTGFGQMIYAVGGNSEAARLAGMNVTAVRIAAYAICSGLVALAGVMEAGRIASAAPTLGVGFELTVGAAVLLGGTSFLGGSGGMFGTLLGVLFLGVLSNGLTITGISSFWQGFVTGAVLILAVLLDRFRLPGGNKSTPLETKQEEAA